MCLQLACNKCDVNTKVLADMTRLRWCLLLQNDCQLQNAVDLIVDCAFGRSPYTDSSQIPALSTCVDVAVRESAYNPLHPQNQLQQHDETLYVAFQQRIQIKVCQVVQLLCPAHVMLKALMLCPRLWWLRRCATVTGGN